MHDEILQEGISRSSDYDNNLLLLRELKRGNEKALDEIVVLNSPLVMMIAKNVTGGNVMAKELPLTQMVTAAG